MKKYQLMSMNLRKRAKVFVAVVRFLLSDLTEALHACFPRTNDTAAISHVYPCLDYSLEPAQVLRLHQADSIFNNDEICAWVFVGKKEHHETCAVLRSSKLKVQMYSVGLYASNHKGQVRPAPASQLRALFKKAQSDSYISTWRMNQLNVTPLRREWRLRVSDWGAVWASVTRELFSHRGTVPQKYSATEAQCSTPSLVSVWICWAESWTFEFSKPCEIEWSVLGQIRTGGSGYLRVGRKIDPCGRAHTV